MCFIDERDAAGFGREMLQASAEKSCFADSRINLITALGSTVLMSRLLISMSFSKRN